MHCHNAVRPPQQHMLCSLAGFAHTQMIPQPGHRNYKSTTNVRNSCAFTNDGFFGLNVSRCFCSIHFDFFGWWKTCVLLRCVIACRCRMFILTRTKYQFGSNSCADLLLVATIHSESHGNSRSRHTCHIINFQPTAHFSSLHRTNANIFWHVLFFFLHTNAQKTANFHVVPSSIQWLGCVYVIIGIGLAWRMIRTKRTNRETFHRWLLNGRKISYHNYVS